MKCAVSKFLTLVFVVSFSLNLFGQEKVGNSSLPLSKLINESPYSGSEFESANIDLLRNEVANNPGSKGLMILYCGKNCQYGEVEAHLRGIDLSLRGKGMKENEFLILNGGFKTEFKIEYWLVPENACLPIPKSEVDIKDVKFKRTFKRKVIAYDCC